MSLSIVRVSPNPLVTMTDVDIVRLTALASAAGHAGSPVADFLMAELDRAVVLPVDQITPDTVRMYSRVAFRIGRRSQVEVRTLVYPADCASQQARDEYVSILTPLGAALIGLRAGTGMSYQTDNSRLQHVAVEAVLYQDSPAENKTITGRLRGAAVEPARRNWRSFNEDDPGPAAA